MSLFAIFGSGFGLYGYLPALIACGQRVLLLNRYRACLNARSELDSYVSQVEWEIDEYTALKRVTGIVIALHPSLQLEWVSHCLMQSNLQYLLLEKPLAPSPKSAIAVLDNLLCSGKDFRIGYIFRYTAWGKQLLATLGCVNDIHKLSIQWFFEAHHFCQNIQTWKRSHRAGGGVIRFYGIHVIALLAEIGYSDVTVSRMIGLLADECEKWQATFIGTGLPQCDIVIDSRASMNQFQVIQNSHSIDLRDPFDLGNHAGSLLDQRVPVLHQLCHSLCEPNPYAWYTATLQLWLVVENKTIFEKKKIDETPQ